MEPVLSYNFDEIEYTVRQEIHSTSARLNAALEDLRGPNRSAAADLDP